MRIRALRWRWLVAGMLTASSILSAQMAPADTARHQQAIQFTIDTFKSGDIAMIAKRIQFPLARNYPLPPVNNAHEFARRYPDIFDSELSQLISTSAAKTDWSKMGWRGYMLQHGLVWAGEDGLIIAINYESRTEQALRARLIEADRRALHESLRSFDEPVLKWDTPNYRLRIDARGDHYRLALWPAGRGLTDKPELIIEHGTRIFDGSGGNHHYAFPFGKKAYVCDVEVIGGEGERHIGSFDLVQEGVTLRSEDALKAY